MSNNKNKYQIKKMCDSNGGSYVTLSGARRSEEGRVNSYGELKSQIASYAAHYHLEKVSVSAGRNIMDEDGPTAVYTVSVVIS